MRSASNTKFQTLLRIVEAKTGRDRRNSENIDKDILCQKDAVKC